MVRIYANRVEAGAKKLSDVPTKLRDEVKELVISERYEFDENGYAHKAEVKETNEEE